jgi:hypothetical protein
LSAEYRSATLSLKVTVQEEEGERKESEFRREKEGKRGGEMDCLAYQNIGLPAFE